MRRAGLSASAELLVIFSPFGLKLPIHAHLGEFGDMTGFPLELGIGARGQKTRMMGLPDGRKSFKIGLAVLIQYRCVTRETPSQLATLPYISKIALTYTSRA